ncbi:MAG: hypothetical protein AAGF11_26385 [Myxococcota bacterium]
MNEVSLSSGDGAELVLGEDTLDAAVFELPEYIEYEGRTYSLQVNELRRLPDETVVDGETWVNEQNLLRSSECTSLVDLIIEVVATDSNGDSVSGEGVVLIRFMGKPQRVDMTEPDPDTDIGVAS